MRKYCSVCALALAAVCSGLAQPPGVSAARITLPWSAGWDIFTEPLNYRHSFVSFDQSAATNNIQVLYRLEGAVPNSQHLVGIDLYWGPVGTPSTGMCVTDFGQFTASNCGYACRQGICRTYNSFELGVVTANSSGNASFTRTVRSVTPGTYELQYFVRETTEPPSYVIYQAPAPYGSGTVTLTVP